MTQIDPPILVLFRHLRRQCASGALHLFRPVVTDVVGADGDIGLHPGPHVIAQDLRDASDGGGSLGGLVDDLSHHHLALLRLPEHAAGDDDVLAQALGVRHHEADAALLVELADHGMGIALQHLNHRAFEAIAAIHAGDPYHGAIVVQHRAHLFK